jgi:hypothetical protein
MLCVFRSRAARFVVLIIPPSNQGVFHEQLGFNLSTAEIG